jgi:hypothetical protein
MGGAHGGAGSWRERRVAGGSTTVRQGSREAASGLSCCYSASYEFLFISQTDSNLQWFKSYLLEIKNFQIKYVHVGD